MVLKIAYNTQNYSVFGAEWLGPSLSKVSSRVGVLSNSPEEGKGHSFRNNLFYKKNSVVWVRERTIPTERPQLFDEVIANFCGWRVSRGQRDGSLRPYFRFSRPEPLLFYQAAPQLYSRGWVDPVPDPILLRKSGSAANRTRDSGSVAKNSDH
jgi:hypothetical protein